MRERRPTDPAERAGPPMRSGPTERVDQADPLPDQPRSSEALERGDTIPAEAARQGRTVLTSSGRRWVFVLGLAGVVIVIVLLAIGT